MVIILDGAMDKLNFHMEHNSGYFSLTYPVESFIGADAWHDMKKTAIVIIISIISFLQYGWTWKFVYLFCLLALLNYLLHELVLHYI